MMVLTTISVLVCLFATALSTPPKGVELQTPQGTIYGTSEQARNGRTFYSFRGIPFAKPPTGTRRFKNPEAADNWSGIRNGSWIAPECPQPDKRGVQGFSLNLPKDEDCLYLNVFTPMAKSRVAVMVYIHGGGFGSGDMTVIQPHFLLTEDVVLVTIQYRIGFLGFLSTEDDVAPGNLGLKDQTQALRWVKNNIQVYGGDPHRVTVFGESAGGIAAHLLMFTPASRGLFNRVIIQSGTAIFPGVTKKGGFREHAQELGQLFNCSTQESGQFNSTELISCLQQIPASQFIQPEARKNKDRDTIHVDGDYMPASPKQLMLMGDYHKCDIMAGFTQHEMAGPVLAAILENKTETEDLVKIVKHFVGVMFDLIPGGNVTEKMAQVDSEIDSLVAQTLQYYTRQQNISSENYEQVVKILTSLFSLSHDQIIQLHARDTLYNKNVFAYEFKHRGQTTVMHLADDPQYDDNIVTHGNNWVHHGDDLLYLFSLESINVTLTQPEDIKMSQVMVELWTNFAMYGNPTPDDSLGFTWSPVSLSSQRQQLVLKPEPYMETNDRCKDLEFWQSLPHSESFIITEQKCDNNVMCVEFYNDVHSVRQIYWRHTLATPRFQDNIYSQEELMFPNPDNK